MATMSAPEPGKFNDSDTMNYAIRMVIPMKREFGLALDVPHFLHDFAYAKEVLDVASSSQDDRLREYAEYLQTKLFGPRNSTMQPAQSASAGPATPQPTAPQAAGPTPADSESGEQTEAQMRAELMKKYKKGLR